VHASQVLDLRGLAARLHHQKHMTPYGRGLGVAAGRLGLQMAMYNSRHLRASASARLLILQLSDRASPSLLFYNRSAERRQGGSAARRPQIIRENIRLSAGCSVGARASVP
jgi:hypothetical protein